MNIISYEDIEEIFQNELVNSGNVEVVIICPDPVTADMLWAKATGLLPNFSTITISKFINDLLQIFHCDISPSGKEELILKFAFIAKRVGVTSFEHYLQIYNLFSELRSYTLDSTLIQQVLDEYDEVTSTVVKYLWNIIVELKMVDEHAACKMLAESLLEKFSKDKDNVVGIDKKYVFASFKFMNGQQIDFIKSLALVAQVFIAIPTKVYESSIPSDWIRWVYTSDMKQIKEKCLPSDKSCRVALFSKGRLNQMLKTQLQLSSDNMQEIFLLEKKTALINFQEIPLQNVFHKSKIKIFEDGIDFIKVEIENKMHTERKQNINADEVFMLLDDCLTTQLKSNTPDYKKIKAILLMKDVIHEWGNMSFHNQQIDNFDLKLFYHICVLRFPRIYNIPLINDSRFVEIKGMEEINSFRQETNKMICASSSYTPLKSTSEKYTEKVSDILKTIGPVARRDFEFQFTKNAIIKLITDENSVLFLEKELFENDPGWSEILSEISTISHLVVNIDMDSSRHVLARETLRLSEHQSLSFSSSKLQSYFDCPAKFYYNYVNKIGQDVNLKSCLMARQIGVLEHKVIENYCIQYKVLDSENLENAVIKQLNGFLQEKDIILAEEDFYNFFLEIRYFCQNAISAIFKLKQMANFSGYEFEYVFKDHDGERFYDGGRIDLIVRFDDFFALLDFKRSLGGIPTDREFLNFEQMQMWYYLSHSGFDVERLLFCGYLNISEIEKSLIYSTSEFICNSLNEIGFLQSKILKFKDVDFSDRLMQYAPMEQAIKKEMMADVQFLPNPRRIAVCDYCVVRNICGRGISL